METKLTDFTKNELEYMLKGILDRRQTLRNLLEEVSKFKDLTKLHEDFIPGYESEIKSLVATAAKISTAIEYVKDKKRPYYEYA